MQVTLLAGGATPERAVAFAGAAQIVAALRGRGHTVRVVDTTQGLVSEAEDRPAWTDEARAITNPAAVRAVAVLLMFVIFSSPPWTA